MLVKNLQYLKVILLQYLLTLMQMTKVKLLLIKYYLSSLVIQVWLDHLLLKELKLLLKLSQTLEIKK
ncbi:UNVERIFIED_CONTAM: hypothetical protein GTU68_040845 [Idotea baltica]|nr:hypothetical protein [Idotea baltica]